jgi:hypothetical protein
MLDPRALDCWTKPSAEHQVSAIIATIAPGAAWLSTDSLREDECAVVDRPGKFALLHQGHAVAAGIGRVGLVEGWCQWIEQRSWLDAVDGTSAFLRRALEPATMFLVRAGAGFAFTFEDGYQSHALQYNGHSCRPSFVDLPNVGELREASVTAGQGEAVEAFHYSYLCCAAAWPDKPRPIGGRGFCARLTEAGAEMLELGALRGEH